MIGTITQSQLEEIEERLECGYTRVAYCLLEDYTGIKAKEYTAFDFYDGADDYLGNNMDNSIRDIIYKAGIDVIGDDEDD